MLYRYKNSGEANGKDYALYSQDVNGTYMITKLLLWFVETSTTGVTVENHLLKITYIFCNRLIMKYYIFIFCYYTFKRVEKFAKYFSKRYNALWPKTEHNDIWETEWKII